MRFDRRLSGIGLFLIVFGVVLLAGHEGLIPSASAERAWTLLPLLLVGSGLSLVLVSRPGAAIDGLIVALTLGAP
jgi:hypothetical protein